MTKTIDYDKYLIESLKDPEEAVGYLNAALEDGDLEVFLSALRNVVQARGEISTFSQADSKSRNIFTSTNNPYLYNAQEILNAIGLTLRIAVRK